MDGEVLFVDGASGVLDEKRRHGAPPVQVVAQFVVVAVRRQIPGREVPWWAPVKVSVSAASTRSGSAGRRFDPGPHKCHRHTHNDPGCENRRKVHSPAEPPLVMRGRKPRTIFRAKPCYAASRCIPRIRPASSGITRVRSAMRAAQVTSERALPGGRFCPVAVHLSSSLELTEEAQVFAQIIRGKVSDPNAVRPVVDRWMKELGPTANGWLGSTSGITDDNEVFVLVRFESEEAARANSDRPEQGQWWAEMEKLFDGEPTFQDSSDVQVDTSGDPNAAGFVQVMTGQVTDADRVRQLMAQQPDMRQLRPDILGSVTVNHDDGKWSMVIYFTSEAEARKGEAKEMPPEAVKVMEEMQSLSVGPPEFLDLKTPWLDSPK